MKSINRSIFRLPNWSKFSENKQTFVLSFENNAHRTSYNWYFLPAVEIKDYNAMINGKNFFDNSMKICKRTCDNIWKTETGQKDDNNY